MNWFVSYSESSFDCICLDLPLFEQKNAKVVTIDSYEDVPVNDEKSLQKAAASQPISVAIEAGGRDFQLYVSVRHLYCRI